MFKVRRWVCLALVCALVGVAYAGAVKFRSFTIFDEPPDADAMAIINIADSQGTILQVMVTGFSTNTPYSIGRIDAGGDGTSDIAYRIDPAFTTDDRGNATWHGTVGSNFPWSNIGIYFNNGTFYELRARGNP